MSVPKNKRSHGELEVLTRARELKTHTLGICTNTNNFPKRYRWCITNDIIKEVCELCRLIVRANSIRIDKINEQDCKRRFLYQKQAYELTEVILEDIDTAYAFFRIPSNSIEYWVSLVMDVQNLLKGWMRSDIRAASEKSPNVGNANNVRNVNPTGANDNNNANNSNGVAPDFIKKPV